MAMSVELEEQEWQQVMVLLANGPWREANPLLMKIGAQLQARRPGTGVPPGDRMDIRGNPSTKEVGHG